MQRYFDQLQADIAFATENVSLPFINKTLELHDWISEEEEDRTAPVINLQEWTGISATMLPPEEMLNDEQVDALSKTLKKMLDAYNWSFVLQTAGVPEPIQYATIRANFDQPVKIKHCHMGFFELCAPGTQHKTCTLGEHCQCAFYAALFSGFVEEQLTPEEERAKALEIEVQHIKRKYGNDWMKYYPYHLDEAYDNETGNPYNYGFGDDEENEEDDQWL